MLCAKCAAPLEVPRMANGAAPSFVLTPDSKPLPLRCPGCAKVVCHLCQSEKVQEAEGITAAHVSLACTFCGDRLELLREEAPPAPAAPLTDERRRELKQAYKEQQRAEAQARGVPPGIRSLLDPTRPAPAKLSKPASPSVAGGCLAILITGVLAIAGYNKDPDGSYLGLVVGGVVGFVIGAIVETILDALARLFDRLRSR